MVPQRPLPALSMLEVAYELLMIVWFGWLGIAMLRSAGHSQQRVVAPEPNGRQVVTASMT